MVVVKGYCVYTTDYMNTVQELLKNNIVAVGIMASIALIASSSIIAGGIAGLHDGNTISVTGSAERIVTSDAGKWTFTITKQAEPASVVFVSKQIRDAQEIAAKYLVNRGVEGTQITVQPIVSNVLCQSQNQVMYDNFGRQQCSGSYVYNLTQTIIVESNDVTLIKDLSLNAPSALSTQGASIQTTAVDFFYTKLADLRVELLSLATANAKERADAIAKSAGDAIGGIQDASQGVFQVTQKNSTDVSDYGSYDTSTVEKKVTAIVRASFEVR